MTNQTLYLNAERLVNNCAIPPHLSGFVFLSDAVVIKSKSRTAKLLDIYNTIALEHNSTHRAVTRDISYAISKSDSIGAYLDISKQNLFNGRVIAALAIKLKEICQFDSQL